MRVIGISLMVLLLAGCAGNAAVIEALAKDTANICAHITTIYGSADILRSNMPAVEMSCGSITFKAQGVTSVPVTVIPQATPNPLPVTVVPQK